jgi:hypothetical protein
MHAAAGSSDPQAHRPPVPGASLYPAELDEAIDQAHGAGMREIDLAPRR